jgi:hypothetical protein
LFISLSSSSSFSSSYHHHHHLQQRRARAADDREFLSLSTHSPPSADPSGSGWRSEIAEPISMGATFETAQESAAVSWEVRPAILFAGGACDISRACVSDSAPNPHL